jgi:hypothetical protein
LTGAPSRPRITDAGNGKKSQRFGSFELDPKKKIEAYRVAHNLSDWIKLRSEGVEIQKEARTRFPPINWEVLSTHREQESIGEDSRPPIFVH